jgi:hypothetical protein
MLAEPTEITDSEAMAYSSLEYLVVRKFDG